MRLFVILALVTVSAVTLVTPAPLGDDGPVVAADWHPRESKALRQQIDAAVFKYAEALSKAEYPVGGARTLQALGLVAALPRLEGDKRKDVLKKAIAVVKDEAADYWPGKEVDATERAEKLYVSASYHLPLVLLLLEHQQAGALPSEEGVIGSRDREMRFGIIPTKAVRRDIVRLLALLLAGGYGKEFGAPGAFDAELKDGHLWSYSSFGRHDNSCVSPTGMASIGLSAAVFGLNVLEYDLEDFDITFAGQKLHRKDIRDRLVDVCTHLILSLVNDNHFTAASELKGVTVDITHLDAEAFREVIAPGVQGDLLVRLQAEKADLVASKGKLNVYHYRGNEGARGAYFAACAAYSLPTAVRVLALALEREATGDTVVGKRYPFKRTSEGKWQLLAAGGWTIDIVPEPKRLYSPLSFSKGGKPLDIDGTVTGALNTCVSCMTVRVGENGHQRRLRGFDEKTPDGWIQGSTSVTASAERYAALHAFALYKAAVVTGDGYNIGRWTVWQDLAAGLAKDGFVAAQINAIGTGDNEMAAALAFATLTMTRTYRPIFPKSELNPTKK